MTMTQKQLTDILAKHAKWLRGEEGGERADLREANLRGADLSRADLREANLSDADLSGARLNYSAWPLWCGSLGVKVDVRIARQLAYHLCRLECEEAEYKQVVQMLKPFANQFHRAEECGRIE